MSFDFGTPACAVLLLWSLFFVPADLAVSRSNLLSWSSIPVFVRGLGSGAVSAWRGPVALIEGIGLALVRWPIAGFAF